MANGPLRQCRRQGCSELIRGDTLCPKHRQQSDDAVADKKRQWMRDNADRYSLYQTAEWKRIRAAHLSAHPLCVECGQKGNVVDHIQPHLGDWGLFSDPDNLQTFCVRHHASKTSKHDSWNRKRD